MTGEDAIKFIHGFSRFGSKLGLERIRKLLDMMENPHEKLKYIHIAGTNGKGSTASFISSILRSSGYRVGLYTSPALERFTQRIKVDGDEICMETLGNITERVKALVEVMVSESGSEMHPTEFELVTAIAFQYYFERRCHVVVLETGLGGRYDATNVIGAPLAAVITTINYDHMDRLGNTLPEIAYEKAGIIKDRCEVVLYPQEPDVRDVIEKVCREKNAGLTNVDFKELDVISNDFTGVYFSYYGLKDLRIKMIGRHQARNAAVAIHTAMVLNERGMLNISEEHIRKGLLSAEWPGRLEVACAKPLFIIDGAHNVECARALKDALAELFPGKKLIFILGVLGDKDVKGIIEEMLPIATVFITTEPDSTRALPAEELTKIIRGLNGNAVTGGSPVKAVEEAIKAAGEDGVICAYGSLYYIGAVRKYIMDYSCKGGAYDQS